MKVAVITPYWNESVDTLARCIASVQAQTHVCRHWLVADGRPSAAIDTHPVEHVILDSAHADNGNTPRGIGAVSALNSGYDAVAFLDADNWFEPDHVRSCVELAEQSDAAVIFTSRVIVFPDGERCHFEDEDVLDRRAVDTSSMFITRTAAFLLPCWALMDPICSPICDRVMFRLIELHSVRVAWTGRATVRYESRWPDHFEAMNREPPADAHHTDWDRIEANYRAGSMEARLGTDPFVEGPPNRVRHAPACLVDVERLHA